MYTCCCAIKEMGKTTSSEELNIELEKKDSLFGSTDLGSGIDSGPSLQQQPDHVGISSFRCHMERCDVILSQYNNTTNCQTETHNQVLKNKIQNIQCKYILHWFCVNL